MNVRRFFVASAIMVASTDSIINFTIAGFRTCVTIDRVRSLNKSASFLLPYVRAFHSSDC